MKRVLAIVAILLALTIAGCEQKVEEKLVVGILPIEDALPIVVASDEGIFEKYGLKVEVVKFNSALERDAALMAGKVDAVITDPLAVILLRDKGYDVKIVTLCLGEKPSEGVFAILTAPNSSIQSVYDLKEIAISSNTIIEYVTDMLLSRYNVSYKKIEVKQIPVRFRMLLDGKIEAATLPEPLASYAVAKGAKLILSDAMVNESLTQTVIVFRGEYIKQHPDAIDLFLKAYSEAVAKINAEPAKYREKFIDIARVPKDIADKYPMPKYPQPKKLPEEFYARYLNWALSKGLISRPVPYSEAVYD